MTANQGAYAAQVMAGTSHVEVVNVTPEQANAWLEFNVRNRALSQTSIRQWADDMVNGRWTFNGMPICFDREGRLINGQHRLHAIVMAGVTIQMLVVYGLEPSSQMTMDIGRTRAVGQQLSLLGISNGADMASMGTALIRWKSCGDRVWASSNRPSKPEVMNYVILNHDVMAKALIEGHAAQKATGAPRVTHAAVAARARMTGWDDEWGYFHAGFISGANLSVGDSRLELRSRIIRLSNRSGQNEWYQQQRVAVTTKAFNAYLEGRSVKLLRFNRDELPMPDVG